MLTFLTYIDTFVTKLANRETDPINQARVKMLVYLIFSYIFFSATSILAYTLEGPLMQLLRAYLTFALSITFIIVIKYTNSWRFLAHGVIILLALAIFSNLSFYVKGINVATLQFIWLGCMFSFYMLGHRWGWFYSLITILPVITFHIIDDKNFFLIGSAPQKINQITYIYVITYNFSLIVFLHYFFFRVFNNNFLSLTETKNQLDELNQKLKNTLVEVEELSKSRMDFLSTMSHELRTPLNGIIGMANTLSLSNPREDQKENLEILKFSVQNLLSLVNNVLDLNKLESDKVELENTPFNLVKLIQNNCASIQQRINDKLLEFNIEIDEELEGKTVYGDPTRLTQVLLNLLNNAVNFTNNGSITLRVKCLQNSNDEIKIGFSIKDTGIGIEPDKINKIFDAYMQGDINTHRQYGGTGLGLPIIKKILEIYGSTIKVESVPNIGSKFSFNISFGYESNKLPDNINLNLITKLPSLKILVVEDNMINIHVIKKTLELWDIVPETAENGLKALEKLDSQSFDVILMDLYMPIMDGFETTKRIRNLENEKARTPIIALSATVNNEITQKAMSAGVNDYLSKPFDPAILFEKLQQYTKTHKV